MENRFLIAAAFLAALVVPADAASWLKDSDLAYVFAGREFKGAYSNNAPFTETYHKDNSIDYAEGSRRSKGKWRIDDGAFCTDYEGLPGGCFKVVAQGANCFEYWLLDERGNPRDKSWIARGWQAKYRATCPSP